MKTYRIEEKNGLFVATDIATGRELGRARRRDLLKKTLDGARAADRLSPPGVRLGHGGVYFNGQTWFPPATKLRAYQEEEA